MKNEKKKERFEKVHRVQLDFSEEAFKTLKTLKDRLGAKTNTEVIRQGLGVLRWIVEERSAGKQILSKDDKEVKELVTIP